jgi:hypothetical protein
MIKRYKTKPCEIEAIQWTGQNFEEIRDFVGKTLRYDMLTNTKWDKNWIPSTFFIHTLEGNMEAIIGDYIIKGLRGEFYPCKPDVFEKKYEEI